MSPIHTCELPPEALLVRYLNTGAYTDCYCIEIHHTATQAAYVEAFYTSWLFKLERRLLFWLVRRPSTDTQAGELALGHREGFAAWEVEGRTDDQLLMCDIQGRTRSWLMSEALGGGQGTRLYFGSAIVPVVDSRSGQMKLGFPFHALLGFHKGYSRALLRAAAARLSGNRVEH